MTDLNKRVPALVLAAILLAAAPPVLSGGRDVPDHIAEGNSSSESTSPEVHCTQQAVTSMRLGGMSFDVVTAPDGETRLRPTLLREAVGVLKRLLAPRSGPEDSCPSD